MNFGWAHRAAGWLGLLALVLNLSLGDLHHGHRLDRTIDAASQAFEICRAADSQSPQDHPASGAAAETCLYCPIGGSGLAGASQTPARPQAAPVRLALQAPEAPAPGRALFSSHRPRDPPRFS